MIDLTRIDLATEEDKKFHIDDWARLFKDRQTDNYNKQIDDYSRQLSDQKKQLEEQQAEIERLKSLLEEKN